MTEVKTNQRFHLNSQWSLRNGPNPEEKEMFSRITIEEEGGSSAEDILVLKWRNVRNFLSMTDQTFYIWTEYDLNTKDLDTNLFRCRERFSKVNKNISMFQLDWRRV